MPDILEAAEVEVEGTVRVGNHERHPVEAASIFPEPIFFIKGGIPETFRQLVALLFEDKRSSLSAGVDRLLRGEERHAFFRGSRAGHNLLERPDPKLVARLEYSARIRKVWIGYCIVAVIELPTVLFTEQGQPSRMVVIVRHHNDAQVREQSELLHGFRLRLLPVAEAVFAGFRREIVEPLPVIEAELALPHLLQGVDLQTSESRRVCADGSTHRFPLSFNVLPESAGSVARVSC